MSEFSSFLRPDDIPWYRSHCVYSTFCLSIYLLMDSWVTHLSASVNNTAINVHKYLFKILAFNFGGIYSEHKLLDCMGILLLHFEEPTYRFPQQLYPFTFPPTVHRVRFSTFLPMLDCPCFNSTD